MATMQDDENAPLLDDEWGPEDVDLLAAWIVSECTDSAPSSATASSPSSEDGADKSKRSGDSNATRTRRREEIAYLSERAHALEAELTELRSRTSLPSPLDTDHVPRSDDSEWKSIAHRQQRARERTELENYKLKMMLKSQIKLAQTLERLLQKREHVETMEFVHSRKRPRQFLATDDEMDDATVFSQLMRSIDHSYTVTDSVLRDTGLWHAPRGHRFVQIKRGKADSNLLVEMTDVHSMPFSLESTSGAAWRCITAGYMHLDHQVYHGYDGHENILAIKYAISLSRRRLHVNFSSRAMMKRFISENQIVDVWESMSETEGNHATTGGLRVRERGWTVFKRSSDPEKTTILTCMQMAPLISYGPRTSEVTADEDRQVGLITNLALDYYGNQLDSAQHAMESLLLDERHQLDQLRDLLPLGDASVQDNIS